MKKRKLSASRDVIVETCDNMLSQLDPELAEECRDKFLGGSNLYFILN